MTVQDTIRITTRTPKAKAKTGSSVRKTNVVAKQNKYKDQNAMPKSRTKHPATQDRTKQIEDKDHNT